MADVHLFDVFGDHSIQKFQRHVLPQVPQQLFKKNIGVGKDQPTIQPEKNKPVKPSEVKKSFLSNLGKALQSTPARPVLSVEAVSASPAIYTEEDEGINLDEIEFTKPPQQFDAYLDLFDSPYVRPRERDSPAPVMPQIRPYTMELHSEPSDDECLYSDFSMDSLQDDDLGLPDLY